MLDTMNLAVLIGAGLVVLSVLTSLVSFRVGAPLLLVFLVVGLLAGEDGLLGLDFDNGPTAYFIGSIALAVILFDSGFETRLSTVRTAAWPALVLATLGVLMTTGFVGAAAYLLLDLSWAEALLLGSIVSSTDAAAVFFLLRVGGVTLRERVRSTLEVESGSNDPMAIFLTITLVELIARGPGETMLTLGLVQAFGMQIGVGAVAGLAGGYLIARFVNFLEIDAGLYPVFVLALALCLFAATGMIGGSGFLAVYVAGVVAGNRRLRSINVLRRFQHGMMWLAQIAMFLTLGLLATPSSFPAVIVPAIVLALFLIFVGRPLAVWLCLLPFRLPRNETAFIAWVGLRGAVSILLAILPVIGGLSNTLTFFNVAFIIVLTSLVVQGWTVRPMARRLGLIVPPRHGVVERFELDLPGGASHEVVAYRIAEGSSVAEGHRIPRWARPSLVVRAGQTMRLHQAGRLQPNDYVYIFAPPQQLRMLDRLFAAPVPVNADDREFFGDFPLKPDAVIGTVAAAYGFEPKPGDEGVTVADLLQRAFSGHVEVGDRVSYGPVELIIRTLDDEGRIREVGLAVEPSRPPPPKQTRDRLRTALPRLIRRFRAGRPSAATTSASAD